MTLHLPALCESTPSGRRVLECYVPRSRYKTSRHFNFINTWRITTRMRHPGGPVKPCQPGHGWGHQMQVSAVRQNGLAAHPGSHHTMHGKLEALSRQHTRHPGQRCMHHPAIARGRAPNTRPLPACLAPSQAPARAQYYHYGLKCHKYALEAGQAQLERYCFFIGEGRGIQQMLAHASAAHQRQARSSALRLRHTAMPLRGGGSIGFACTESLRELLQSAPASWCCTRPLTNNTLTCWRRGCRRVWQHRHCPSRLAVLHALPLRYVESGVPEFHVAGLVNDPSALPVVHALHSLSRCIARVIWPPLLFHAPPGPAGDASCELLPSSAATCADWISVTSAQGETQPCPGLTCCQSEEGMVLQEEVCAPGGYTCVEVGPNSLDCQPTAPTGCPAGE